MPQFLLQLMLMLFTLVSLFLFGGFALVSFREKERRAGWVASGFTLFTLVIFLTPLFLSKNIQLWVILAVSFLTLAFLVAMLLPIGKLNLAHEQSKERFDERRTVFARNGLVPGSERFRSYYEQHPGDLAKDNAWRENPGLLSPQAAFAEPFSFAVTNASFMTLATLGPIADGPVASKNEPITSQAVSHYVKYLAKFFGALNAGICELKKEYIYTHVGRGAGIHGEPITLEHKYAIAMTFEMDHALIGANPRPPGIMETGHEYVESAIAAVQLAAAIRNLGYAARAHFEGNYQVIAPPIARDAGLGEIGRMSLLITPRQGPRVRLAIVTTDMPLNPDQATIDPSVIDFCLICKKCATTCPSRAISFENRKVTNGALRWVIDPVACYSYWTKVGTDCGICMRVCPYAHGSSWHHQLIRWGIRSSGFFRRAALVMDDIFYGKTPKPRPVPGWDSLSKNH
jgi:Pyruvate/2-oxoacid:ferredoxin oxidoreductase delta subunit